MLKRYGDLAEVESARRADELREVGDLAAAPGYGCSQAACEFDTVWASRLTGTMTPFGEPGARFGHDM